MQDRPTAAELVQAVHEFLERDVMGAVTGRVAFHTRVALNVLATVQRELELGEAQDAAQRARLVALLLREPDATDTTVDLERELATAIRNGSLRADQSEAAVEHIRATVHEKLEVANPKYLQQ